MGFRRFHKADQTLQLRQLLDVSHPGLKSADDAVPIREQAITGQMRCSYINVHGRRHMSAGWLVGNRP
jgi:hypothetical protein